MSERADFCLIMTTCGSREEADGLAHGLVENHLAACVQISSVTSFYKWEQKINRDEELLLFIKTRSECYRRAEEFIARNHSYEVPEIIQIPILSGLADYLGWIETATR